MAKQAIRTKDIPEWAAKKTSAKTKRRREEGRKMKGKTFEQLSQSEKDVLLKALAVQAGLIDDSDDE
jgi:hypothetical protein